MEQDGVLKVSECEVQVSSNNLDKKELFKILSQLKPKWTEKDTLCMVLSGGYANLTLKCYDKTDPDDSVVFRIWNLLFSTQFEELLNRKTETEMIYKLGKIGVAPKLYAVFKNGICYEFIDGGKLTPAQCKTDEVAKIVAKNFAKVHGTKLEVTSELQPFLIINYVLKSFPINHPDPEENKKLQKSLPSKEEMAKEIEFLEEYIRELNCPIVQSHGDPHAQNMMITNTGNVIFLDYEVSHTSYQPQDLAAFLLLLSIDYSNLNKGFFTGELPDKTYQFKFLRWYLEEWFEISGKNASEVTEKDVERLYVQVTKYTLFTYFHYAMMYFLFLAIENKDDYVHEDLVAIDYTKLGLESLQKYFENKEYLQSLKIPE